MYKYVTNATIKPFNSFCSDLLNQLKQDLYANYKIKFDFHLIGSGAKNLVTQNEKEPFDLDYNFEILNCSIKQLKKIIDVAELKNYIMQFLNERFDKHTGKENGVFKNCQDSTAVITARLINNNNKLEFSFDIGILAKNSKGNFCRLIHHKQQGNESYNWVEVPNSDAVYEKSDFLKKVGKWAFVRESYLNKKNMYLKKNDYNHPSFVVFVETINEIYEKNSKQYSHS